MRYHQHLRALRLIPLLLCFIQFALVPRALAQAPVRISELSNYFGLKNFPDGLTYILDEVGKSFQIHPPEEIISTQALTMSQIKEQLTNHPNKPYIETLQTWGGPVGGGNIKASRNLVSGPIYELKENLHLVDTLSTHENLNGVIGISSIVPVGISFAPNIQYHRTYAHIRPFKELKSTLTLPQDFMKRFSEILSAKNNTSASDYLEKFISEMKIGEMFVISDGLVAGNQYQLGIPLGLFSESTTIEHSYCALIKTTIYKAADGLHVYSSRLDGHGSSLTFDFSYVVKLMSASNSKSSRVDQTDAYLFPNSLSKVDHQNLLAGLLSIFKSNNLQNIKEQLAPFQIDRTENQKRRKVTIGPWSWTHRETSREIKFTLPDQTNKTVVEGETANLRAADSFGFLGSMVNSLIPIVSFGKGASGDDPSTNPLGRLNEISVNTEIETTPYSLNKTHVMLQQTISGWTMRKNRIVRIAKRMVNSLGEFKPENKIVNESALEDSPTLQSYRISWNLSLNEVAVEKILALLNSKITSDENALLIMVQIMGGNKKFTDWCSLAQEAEDEECYTPWMKTIFALRRDLINHPAILSNNIHSQSIAEEKIKWLNQSIINLQSTMAISEFIRWVGQDQSFAEVTVSGFIPKDESGDLEYFSKTINGIGQKEQTGPLTDIQNASQISTNELSGKYLSLAY